MNRFADIEDETRRKCAASHDVLSQLVTTTVKAGRSTKKKRRTNINRLKIGKKVFMKKRKGRTWRSRRGGVDGDSCCVGTFHAGIPVAFFPIVACHCRLRGNNFHPVLVAGRRQLNWSCYFLVKLFFWKVFTFGYCKVTAYHYKNRRMIITLRSNTDARRIRQRCQALMNSSEGDVVTLISRAQNCTEMYARMFQWNKHNLYMQSNQDPKLFLLELHCRYRISTKKRSGTYAPFD